MKSLKDGHRERLRCRYLHSGENGLPDYDMLELLLTYAIHRRDVKQTARELLERFHSLSGVLDAGKDELCKIGGIGPNSAILIALIRDLCNRYLENHISGLDVLKTEKEVHNYVRMRLASYTSEVFLVMYLDVKNQIIGTDVLARGSTDTIVLNPKMIAEEAVAHKSSSLIIAHNHPSGRIDPSSSDKDFTRRLEKVLAPLEIALLDHLVVSKIDTFSFRNHNLL